MVRGETQDRFVTVHTDHSDILTRGLKEAPVPSSLSALIAFPIIHICWPATLAEITIQGLSCVRELLGRLVIGD